MKTKTRKKQRTVVSRIVIEAASTDLPLTAFLSLFSDQADNGLAMDPMAIRYGSMPRRYRKCS
ncbi:MAG: hypothetical protein JXA71_00050 [Chitinispirillaceae bacterium]|nr:hypothetical protein [Chitinispirillaceae bacterium]